MEITCVVDLGSNTDRVKPKTIKLVLVATPLRSKNKDWWARQQNHVSEWNNMSTRGLLFK